MKTSADLRNLMFIQLEALVNPQKEVDLDRARMVCDTGQVIVNAARAEVEYIKATHGVVTSPFFEEQEGVEERPYIEQGPTHVTIIEAPKPSEQADTQAALGFGRLPTKPAADHPFRMAAKRAAQEKQDKKLQKQIDEADK